MSEVDLSQYLGFNAFPDFFLGDNELLERKIIFFSRPALIQCLPHSHPLFSLNQHLLPVCADIFHIFGDIEGPGSAVIDNTSFQGVGEILELREFKLRGENRGVPEEVGPLLFDGNLGLGVGQMKLPFQVDQVGIIVFRKGGAKKLIVLAERLLDLMTSDRKKEDILYRMSQILGSPEDDIETVLNGYPGGYNLADEEAGFIGKFKFPVLIIPDIPAAVLIPLPLGGKE